VAGALVVGAAVSLFGAHTLAYRAGKTIFEETLEEVSEAEIDEYEGDEDLEEVLEDLLGEDD
jgi:hypothetical protein